ncbi:winged helix DNA-binding domain-containing protein [Polaribacter undariae]|uniref:Winged helix DNA-binding domain-containing protein n=1 Tax=Polaribacter sejongensis TaxID=985043 RepID=A0AAJ1QVM8_9FLAO|nr:winged helix DNA-binding domain-containing protein [Polaribacter undariae]MDN3618815.1 winged helix DNA-binding domain-containing protein [Polaribacter undariae]UWD32906.1 winged helix DNA-binding domain-containing protein [Polaribacter undariae]
MLSQRVFPGKLKGTSLANTLASIEHLGYLQIDTISVIQRAHHHTLWNRNPEYQLSDIDTLIETKQVFEYWSHAAAYLPIRDFKYSLPRKHAILKNEQSHWFQKDAKLMDAILKRIDKEGPLMAKDFAHTAKVGEWESKPAKQALENLFMQGDLMISSRKNFHKVYDLTERVLPDNIDAKCPTAQEHIRFLITSYLRANGIGQAGEVAYLLKNTKALVTAVLKEMYANKELQEVHVSGQLYYSLPNALSLLSKPMNSQLKILSPFDNLLIQRKRMQHLFNFDYKIECYTPAVKRKYGYFSLPILWDGKLVARMDCKADKKSTTLHIHHLFFEENFSFNESFKADFIKEIEAFKSFNNCSGVEVHKTTPSSLLNTIKSIF